MAGGREFDHVIINGSCRTGHKKISTRHECQMIGGDAWLKRCKYKNLPVAVDFKNRSTPVPYIKVLVLVKCDSGGDAHPLCINGTMAVRRDLVNRSFNPARNIKNSVTVVSHAGGIDQV